MEKKHFIASLTAAKTQRRTSAVYTCSRRGYTLDWHKKKNVKKS